MNLRVLVVDDSAVYRLLLSEALSALPNVDVVGVAATGHLALDKLEDLRPDLMTLDILLPDISGLDVLQIAGRRWPKMGVVIVSAHTIGGGASTVRGLELGAFDLIAKPLTASPAQTRAELLSTLGPIVRAFRSGWEVRAILRGKKVDGPDALSGGAGNEANAVRTLHRVSDQMARVIAGARAEVVLIGVSTGGPNALAQVLPALPGDLPAPILVVQHMPQLFTRSLAESLNAKCLLRVKEAEDGEPVLPRTVYLAPGGKQMKVVSNTPGQRMLRITDDPPENGCRPSVDYLLRSAADAYPGRACAVIMTGMGSDGTRGLALLKRTGCRVIVQDAPSSVVYGMARSAIDANLADIVVPLDSIANQIRSSVLGW